MSVEQRDFSNFVLGDDPRLLADGLLFRVAEGVQIDIGDQSDIPDPEKLSTLVARLGVGKVLRDNLAPRDVWDLDEAAGLVDVSGILEPLDRSLWTPEIKTPDTAVRVVTGGVANWQDRGLELLIGREERGKVIIAAGSRVMSSATELNNPNVIELHARVRDGRQHYPTEATYARTVVKLPLEEAGYEVIFERFDGEDNEGILRQLPNRHIALPSGQVAAVRVANAGVQLACQLRGSMARVSPRFDSDPGNPQQFIITDGFPVATAEEQLDDPVHYQSPYTALRQIAVTGKLLAEAAIEQRQ